jgi:hypothetical protein
MMEKKIQVYAVVRIDGERMEDAVTIKEILPTQEEASREVERLNQLNKDKGAHYFFQVTRYFPNGVTLRNRNRCRIAARWMLCRKSSPGIELTQTNTPARYAMPNGVRTKPTQAGWYAR